MLLVAVKLVVLDECAERSPVGSVVAVVLRIIFIKDGIEFVIAHGIKINV